MIQRTIPWCLLILLLTAGALRAQSEGRRSASDTMIPEKPAQLREAPPLEGEILHMALQQVDTHLAGPPPQAKIALPSSETLGALPDKNQTVPFDISWYSVDGGGGMMSTGGIFTLSGTIGQPDAGTMTGPDLTLRGGFWAVVETDVLVVIPEVYVAADEGVEVPIGFKSSDFDISAAIFSVDFDEACLDFDPTDADLDGIPDSVSLSLPPDFEATVTYDASDTDGELDFIFFDIETPLPILPDGDVATITFTTLCLPDDRPVVAPVVFSDAPPPTFGSTLGQDVPGRGVNGFVAILPGTRGDCNADDLVTAGDLSACVLEFFDGDGDCWLDVPEGTFPGNPVGCNANGDEVVDAGDLSCKMLLIFEGPGACDVARRLPVGWDKPFLSINDASRIGNQDTGSIVPVYFRSQGWEINSLAFSVDYDEHAFAFDPSDKDNDGIPDAIRFDLSASAQATVSFDRADTDGELDISIFDPYQALDRGSGEALLTITLKPLRILKPGEGRVDLSRDPAASFGDLSGQSVEGSTSDNQHK